MSKSRKSTKKKKSIKWPLSVDCYPTKPEADAPIENEAVTITMGEFYKVPKLIEKTSLGEMIQDDFDTRHKEQLLEDRIEKARIDQEIEDKRAVELALVKAEREQQKVQKTKRDFIRKLFGPDAEKILSTYDSSTQSYIICGYRFCVDYRPKPKIAVMDFETRYPTGVCSPTGIYYGLVKPFKYGCTLFRFRTNSSECGTIPFGSEGIRTLAQLGTHFAAQRKLGKELAERNTTRLVAVDSDSSQSDTRPIQVEVWSQDDSIWKRFRQFLKAIWCGADS